MPSLFDPQKFFDKAEWDFLIEGNEVFTYSLRLGKEALDPVGLEREILSVGFVISKFVDRKLGFAKISFPSEIRFNLALLLKRRPGLKKVRSIFLEASSQGSEIDVKGFISKNRHECRKKCEILVSSVKLAEYIILHQDKVSGLYPRQIPHGQSTKLLLENTLSRRLLAFHLQRPQLTEEELCSIFGLKRKPAYFHIYADHTSFDGHLLTQFHGIITEDNVNRYDFASLKRVLIVENAEAFYPIHNQLTDTLVLLGEGKQAAGIGFLKDALSTQSVYYWGDIDKAGYEILNLVNEALGRVRPLLMDIETIDSFSHLIQDAPTGASAKGMLLPEEYARVCSEGIQIEQEQLPIEIVINKLLGSSELP